MSCTKDFVEQDQEPQELFTIIGPIQRDFIPCCDHNHILSCVEVRVSPEVLTTRNDIIINNVSLTFTNFIPPHALTYKTDQGDEAVISYNEIAGSIIGTLKTVNGHSFALESCHDHFIFEEFNLTSFKEEELSEHIIEIVNQEIRHFDNKDTEK